jgi:hypothetical protein
LFCSVLRKTGRNASGLVDAFDRLIEPMATPLKQFTRLYAISPSVCRLIQTMRYPTNA